MTFVKQLGPFQFPANTTFHVRRVRRVNIAYQRLFSLLQEPCGCATLASASRVAYVPRSSGLADGRRKCIPQLRCCGDCTADGARAARLDREAGFCMEMEHATRVGPNVGYHVSQHKLLLILLFRPFRLNPRATNSRWGLRSGVTRPVTKWALRSVYSLRLGFRSSRHSRNPKKWIPLKGERQRSCANFSYPLQTP